MKKILIFLIVNFFLINNALAEKNYLYCIETLDKVREHFMNEGDVESAAFIEYDDIPFIGFNLSSILKYLDFISSTY